MFFPFPLGLKPRLVQNRIIAKVLQKAKISSIGREQITDGDLAVNEGNLYSASERLYLIRKSNTKGLGD